MRTSLAPLIVLLTACSCSDPSRALPGDAGGARDAGSDGATGADAAGGASGCGADAEVSDAVNLGLLRDYCHAVRDGYVRALQEAELSFVAACGEPIGRDELEHFIAVAERAPSCEAGAFAQDMAALEAAVVAGRLRYDARALTGCRAAGRAADGGSPLFDGAVVAPCDRILEPAVPLGGACERNDECTFGYCKATGVDHCGGTCVPALAPGALCSPRRDVCADGADCEPDGAGAHRCLARVGAGGACGEGLGRCADGLSCLGDCCSALLPRGAPCDPATGGCAEGLFCGGPAVAPPTCVPVPRLGDACDVNVSCGGPCLRCDLAAGRCVARGAAGNPCVPGERQCLPAFDCGAGGRCTLRPRRGEPCAVSPDHPRGNCLYDDDHCEGGVCAPLPELCEPCGRAIGLSDRCQAGECLTEPGELEGECRPPPSLPAPGEPCRNARCREGAWCDEGRCEALRAHGESCLADPECQSGWCDPEDRRCKVPCTGCGSGGGVDFYATLVFFGVLISGRLSGSRRGSGPRAR